MSAIGRKASEAVNAAARRVTDAFTFTNVTNKDGKSGRNGSNDDNGGKSASTRCVDPAAPYGFLDNMCGPMLRNFNTDLAGGSDDADDIALRNRSSARRRGEQERGRGRSGGGEGGRRPISSYDYDDETNATDATGSYDDDDDATNDDESRKKSRGRGRDRKPRPPADSPSEMTGAYSEYDDDTTLNDTVNDASSVYYDKKDKRS